MRKTSLYTLATLLGALGHHVTVQTSAGAALEAAAVALPEVFILDIGLPKMDGISILEQWRRADRNMPVIILTARDRWSDKVTGIDAGADDYLAKPFHMEELLARVDAGGCELLASGQAAASSSRVPGSRPA